MLLSYLDERYTKERYFIAALLVPGDAANDLTAASMASCVERTVATTPCPVMPSCTGTTSRRARVTGPGWPDRVRTRVGVYSQAMPAVADHDVTVIVRSVDLPGRAMSQQKLGPRWRTRPSSTPTGLLAGERGCDAPATVR